MNQQGASVRNGTSIGKGSLPEYHRMHAMGVGGGKLLLMCFPGTSG